MCWGPRTLLMHVTYVPVAYRYRYGWTEGNFSDTHCDESCHDIEKLVPG
jgi:hypothetical protein